MFFQFFGNFIFYVFVDYGVMISWNRDVTMFWFSNLKFLVLWLHNLIFTFFSSETPTIHSYKYILAYNYIIEI